MKISKDSRLNWISNSRTLSALKAERSFPRGKRGQVLVIVLGFLTLMVVLVLLFFTSVMTDRTSSAAAAKGIGARQLAQSAVQMVEGIITLATVPGPAGATNGIDTTAAWASQPGMIRTYGTGSAASSTPLAYYKLYSCTNQTPATSMVVNAGTIAGGYSVDADINGNWNNLPSLYTDLNAPITDSIGNLDFPIVDPRAVASGSAVDGFAYQNTTISTSPVTVPGVVTGGGSGSLLPMPVAWIYVLRDGSLSSPSSGNTTSATFAGTNPPTATNPIVGRIAFWTDDECSKLNLNTASEGTYWDTPIANSGTSTAQFGYPPTAAAGDAQLANYQGAQNEYQRYPGHPATTCLSEVFGNALGGVGRSSLVRAIDGATPRISDSNSGGTVSSLGGTQNATGIIQQNYNRTYASVDDFNFQPSRALQTLNGAGVQTVLQQSRFFLTTCSKGSDLNLFGLPRITIWPVWDDANFTYRTLVDLQMLKTSTVNNSAVPGSSETGVDSGATTSSEHRMEFDRDTALSPTTDFTLARNQQLFSYLQTLTGSTRPVPGFGGDFLDKYPAPTTAGTPGNGAGAYSSDRDQILTEIFDYIRSTNLADQSDSAPGPNVLCTTSYTPSLGAVTSPTTPANNVPLGEVVPTAPTTTSATSGATTTNQGFGRFPTISELALVLVKIDDRFSTSMAENASTNQLATMNITNGPVASITPPTQTLVEWALVPEIFCPMCGYAGLGNNLRIQWTISNLQFGNGSSYTSPLINLNPTTTSSYPYPSNSYQNNTPDMFDGAGSSLTAGRINSNRDSVIGGRIGFYTFLDGVAPASPTGSMCPTGLFVASGSNLTGNSIVINPNPTQYPCTITAKIYSPAGNSATDSANNVKLIQTINFTFPTMTVPIPSVDGAPNAWLKCFRGGSSLGAPTGSPSTASSATFTYGPDPSARGPRLGGTGNGVSVLDSGDVVRSLVPAGTLGTVNVQGDMRLVSMSPVVPSSVFVPDVKYNGTAGGTPALNTDQAVHGLVCGAGSDLAGTTSPSPGFSAGTLITIGTGTSNPYGATPPAVPAAVTKVTIDGATGSAAFPGDWDNGPSLMCDGPYCNKADEGMTDTLHVPYIGNYQTDVSSTPLSNVYFSPNRQLSSPVMFGSLSIGPDHPWRTLLFRPANLPGYQVATGYTHPGNNMATATATTAVPDHLLLDLFRMPVIQPYPISEPLATGGQINLNTQIAPFTYITRTTGLRAVLKSVMITALPNTTSFINAGSTQGYKYAQASFPTTYTRYPIDLANTVNMLTPTTPDTNSTGQTAFPEFTRTTHSLTAPNFFVSASQICDLPLIPIQSSAINTLSGGAVSLSGLATFWQANGLTGDNSLEKPYSLIYPRVTTRSNTFTVHVRAQSLQKVPVTTANPANVWTEGTDQVTGEYRGSFTIEKYFDPTSATITDASGTVQTDANDANPVATAAVRGALWRLVNSKRFGQ